MARGNVFISYSHADDRWRQRLVNHLSVLVAEGQVHLWDDSRIAAGEDWQTRISAELEQAGVALLLVSAPFLGSQFVRQKEIPLILERHERGGMTIYPLLVRHCAWQEVPWLARLQLRPRSAKPLANHSSGKIDELLADVSREVATLVKARAAADGGKDHHDAELFLGTTYTRLGPENQSGERIAKVRVHRAYFIGDPRECYFINITNLSPNRALEVTHVWYEDELCHISVAQRARQLPTRLDLDQSWETWIEVDALPQAHRDNAFEMFWGRTSDGSVFRSERNSNVPLMGSVPGGPVGER